MRLCYRHAMREVEVKLELSESDWAKLMRLARASGRDIADLVADIVHRYVNGSQAGIEVLIRLEDSIADNRELARRLTD